jgi:aerobic carbon-monoxide dehydrogenase small subunit
LDTSLVPIILSVNDEIHELSIDPKNTLADVLREKLGLIGTKMMCNEGECGACTVLIDTKPRLSCLTLAVECEGKHITTIEGLKNRKTGELHPLQKIFIERSGMQCGVCTPGMLLTSKALLDRNPNPTEDEVREALAGNLCRCGNYKRIVECVLAAAEIMRREPKNA